MLEKLDDTNFMLYAAKHYENPECFETLEFYDDLKRFKYLKRLMNKYRDNGDFKERLILNHIIVLLNIFGNEAAVRMLFFKLFDHKETVATILDFLNFMPLEVNNITHRNITLHSSDIKRDSDITKILRSI